MNKKFLPFGVLSLHIKIMGIPVGGTDLPCWKSELAATCSIRVCYIAHFHVLLWDHLSKAYKLWKRHIPSKVKLFIWKAIRGCLSTLTSIHRYQSIPLTMSPCYLIEPETADDHLLLQCPFIHSLWQHLRARCSGISSHLISLST